MKKISKTKIREAVHENYKNIALKNSLGACCAPDSCNSSEDDLGAVSEALGYSPIELKNVPEGSNMGLGCGNPQAFASLKQGETVLDLGSGGGFDCFLAAKSVGETGNIIGVDMTSEMISMARNNVKKGNYNNIEFRLGEIEHLPIADGTIDVIISNCVINLSPEKEQVFQEAFRVLKSGGRIAIADVVSTIAMPKEIKNQLSLYSNCIAGASSIEELESVLKSTGFSDIQIEVKDKSREFIKKWAPGKGIEDFLTSATIKAVKK